MAYLKRKSDEFVAFKAYKAYAENCLGLRIKATWDDKGSEYMGQEYIDFCAEHGIHQQHTEPDEPHQNGVAEQANRTTSEGATALLAQAKLPPSFWGHAVSTFKGDGCKPDVSYFRVFGCLAYVLIHKKDRKVLSLQPHMHKCIFIGYPDGTKAWKFWNPAAKKIIISSHAVFNEQYFPGNSPFINVFGLPLDNVDIPGGPDDAAPPEDGVPDVPELYNQGGDDDYDDPAPPAPPAPQPAPPPSHQLSLLQSPLPPASPPPALPPAPSPSPPPTWPPPAPVAHPPAPSVHQGAQNCTGFRPYPALARKELPVCSSHPPGSLNKRVLECQNLIPQRLRICSASSVPPPPEPECSSSPDPIIEAPVDAPAAPGLRQDSDEEALHVMLAGIEDVYSDPSFDYLSYDEALEVSFKSVVEQASKVNQEHFGEPRSMSEVMALEPEECNKWLKAVQDELQSLVKNGTFKLVLLPPGRKAIGSQWVFWVKHNADSLIECYKGRLVAKGFFQTLASISHPGMAYWKAIKHLFHYIRGTLDYKLTYAPLPKPELFSSFTNADHMGCPDTGRSISGPLWLTEFGYDISSASKLRIDNLSALSVAKNPEHHGCMKHLNLHFYWLQNKVAKGHIEVVHLRTSHMPADILTKSLPKPKVLEMVKMVGLET
ncbi:hypothetical protein GSI_14985 [Ganoderma sinense ZZ0214-1]|uniref:Integrase catalytic domain-containing protein n=1 Tax=Ganoderma sinense ZZ0214-1 TaxID=1077348 RepID=A0A2G8RL53_9APHY|nr:hypothetical protein GSI_14985 [Ganoderma sinense ZZ0214-1]